MRHNHVTKMSLKAISYVSWVLIMIVLSTLYILDVLRSFKIFQCFSCITRFRRHPHRCSFTDVVISCCRSYIVFVLEKEEQGKQNSSVKKITHFYVVIKREKYPWSTKFQWTGLFCLSLQQFLNFLCLEEGGLDHFLTTSRSVKCSILNKWKILKIQVSYGNLYVPLNGSKTRIFILLHVLYI